MIRLDSGSSRVYHKYSKSLGIISAEEHYEQITKENLLSYH